MKLIHEFWHWIWHQYVESHRLTMGQNCSKGTTIVTKLMRDWITSCLVHLPALCTCLPCAPACLVSLVLTSCCAHSACASCTLLLLYRMWMRRLVTAPSIQHPRLMLMLRLMLPCSRRPWRGWFSQNYTFPLGGYIGWGGHYIGTVEPPRTHGKDVVRGGSMCLNYPKLVHKHPTHLASPVKM